MKEDFESFRYNQRYHLQKLKDKQNEITRQIMIGDWVNLKNGKVIMPCRITVIGHATQDRNEIGTTVCVDLSKEFPTCIFDMDVITPIPITPEILKANGFEEDPEDGTMCWGNKELEEVTWRGTILKIDSLSASLELVSCMYVHQLQHALKLCGIGIEIKL